MAVFRDPEGRIRHLDDVMHRAEDENGDPVPAGWIRTTDGTGLCGWIDPADLPAGATTLAALTDVSIVSPLDKQRLRYSTVDNLWHNSSLVWETHFSYDGTAVLDGAGNPVQTEVTY